MPEREAAGAAVAARARVRSDCPGRMRSDASQDCRRHRIATIAVCRLRMTVPRGCVASPGRSGARDCADRQACHLLNDIADVLPGAPVLNR
jgi:hypothetical protein